MQNDHDQKIQEFFKAAGAVAEDGLARLQTEEPGAFMGAMAAFAAGTPLMLLTAFGKDGVRATRLTIQLNGETVELMALEAGTSTLN